jgi:hypothetical protein
LTLSGDCGTKRETYASDARGQRSKKGELMKSQSIFAISAALAFSVAQGGPGAFAQQEIDPNHFDSPDTGPPDQPKSGQSHGIATRYDGNFSLPYAVQCSGEQLAPGKYSVTLRSDGETQF